MKMREKKHIEGLPREALLKKIETLNRELKLRKNEKRPVPWLSLKFGVSPRTHEKKMRERNILQKQHDELYDKYMHLIEHHGEEIIHTNVCRRA